MFVSQKVVSGKPFSKLSCVCLSLGKLVNGKHFPVNEKHFLVNRKYFSVNEKYFPISFSQRKIWLGFQENVFPLAVFVFRKVVSKLSCVCLPLEKLVNEKHFPVKGKFSLYFRKVFSRKNFEGKHFPKVVKNLEMSLFADYTKFNTQNFDCYIYFVLNIYFSISSLKILFLY